VTTHQLLLVVIGAAGLLCTVGIAVLGVVWRLGTKTGEMVLRMVAYDAALLRSDAACERWNAQMIDALKRLDERVDDQAVKLSELENKWRVAHRIAQKVADIDNRLTGIEAVCHDRIRCEISRPIDVEDGAPRLRDEEG
jgi:hypothetical protein